MKPIVLTSDHGNWLLPGFMHQWNKYANDMPVTIYGFTDPGGLNNFVSIGDFKDYPADRWSDGLIKTLHMIDDDIILLMLEDYWLIREVDTDFIYHAAAMMRARSDIVRFDITTDRLYAQNFKELYSWKSVDVFKSYAEDYRFSTQASLWNKEKLLQLLEPGRSPWQIEIECTGKLNKFYPHWQVWGTRQWPMKYSIVVNKGEFDRAGEWMYPARTLYPADWKELDDLGYTRK